MLDVSTCKTLDINIQSHSHLHMHIQDTQRMYSKRTQSDLALCAEVAIRRKDAAKRRAILNENRLQLAALHQNEDSDETLQHITNLVEFEMPRGMKEAMQNVASKK